MKKTFAVAALAATALIGTASAASAYTIDNAGLGLVGKGEVKTALVLSTDAELLNTPLAFTQKVTETKTITWSCTRTQTTGNGTVHVDTRPKANVTTTTNTTDIANTLRFNKNNVLTGFELTGFGASTVPVVTVTGPVVDSCNKNPEGFVHDNNTVTTETVTKDVYVNDVLVPVVAAPIA